MLAQELGLHEQAVGEEREDEGELDEKDDDLRARIGVDDVEERKAEGLSD